MFIRPIRLRSTLAVVAALACCAALAPAQAQARPGSERPGDTWASLAALPDLLNAQWLPQGVPADEKAFMRTMAYPPLKPEFLADAKDAVAAILAGREELPTAHCGRAGMPRLAWRAYPLQFMYAAGAVMIQNSVAETGTEMRLASNGDHPAALRDPDAIVIRQANGDARFVWEGDILVVDTIGAREEIDTFYGVPNDPDLHVVERYRLLDNDTLERISTIAAPTYFTAPWTVRTLYKRGPAQSLATAYCKDLPI